MIETREAVENLDEILSVPNLSGVYIGPADMCSSYGLKPQFDPKDEQIYSNIKFKKTEIIEKVGLPCFVKPNGAGSSYGISKVTK